MFFFLFPKGVEREGGAVQSLGDISPLKSRVFFIDGLPQALSPFHSTIRVRKGLTSIFPCWTIQPPPCVWETEEWVCGCPWLSSNLLAAPLSCGQCSRLNLTLTIPSIQEYYKTTGMAILLLSWKLKRFVASETMVSWNAVSKMMYAKALKETVFDEILEGKQFHCP